MNAAAYAAGIAGGIVAAAAIVRWLWRAGRAIEAAPTVVGAVDAGLDRKLIELIRYQLNPNHGESLVDRVNGLADWSIATDRRLEIGSAHMESLANQIEQLRRETTPAAIASELAPALADLLREKPPG